MKHILSIVMCMVILAACAPKKELVRTGAFYDIAPRFARSQGNMEYFLAYGKGINESECRSNAEAGLIKTLIYQGVRDGININPILNEPQSVAAFKTREQTALSVLQGRSGLIDNSGKPTNRMRQSTDKNALYSMAFEIGVNRSLLTSEVVGTK